MGRFEDLRGWARRTYRGSRDALRQAQQRAQQANDPNGEPRELAPPGRSAPARQPDEAAAARSTQRTTQVAEGADAGPGDTAATPEPEPDRRSQDGNRESEDGVPRSLYIAGAWAWRLIVISLVLWGLLWIANRYILLVAPLMIALLLTGLLMPAQRALVRLRLHRSLAALLVMVGGLGLVGGTLYLVVVAFIAGLDDMVTRVEVGIVEIDDWLRNGPLHMDDADLEELVGQGQEWVRSNTQELTTAGLTAVTGTMQFLTGMILVIVVTFFFLRDGGRIWRFLVGMLPVRARAPMAFAGDGAWRSLSGYVRATVLVALVDAVGIGLGLLILSGPMNFPRPLVLPLAALVFLGGFVPIVGAFVSGGVAVLVGLVTGETPTQGLLQALIVLGIVILVQQVESNVLQPFIVSKMVRIHPLAVILAVMAGILLAGIIGALVAVPVVAVLNTVVRRLNHYHQRRQSQPAELDPAPAAR